ncbi:MAG: CinA family protein [Candidatus Omnitrophica bacterium]|nr:CinA family protein [Candidatus Omnitrophota bacterium]
MPKTNDPARGLFLKLKKRGVTIAVAESCTGGLVSGLLTDIPGVSKVFDGAIVAYSNEVKTRILKIPREIIDDYGAVSAETAEFMAYGVRIMCGADIGISVTGIAGPAGGSAKKPVGLAHLGFSSKKKVISKKILLKGTRLELKQKFALALLKFSEKNT